MRTVNKDILFLCGVIVLCFGFLLFHINPYSIGPNETLEGRLVLLFWHLCWRPVGTFSILSGCVLIFKGLRK